MSDDLRERVARALCCAAAGDKTPTTVPDEFMPRQWASECGHWRALADAALAEIGAVQARELEWVTITPDSYEEAERFGMIYGVSRAIDGDGWVADASPRWSNERDTAKFDARDPAYDWCEDHNQARILAAIETAPVSADDDLDERMKAAGMIPLSEMLNGHSVMEKWMRHAHVKTLPDFIEWVSMKQREYMKMRMRYELGDKDKNDDLYEWVFAHAAVFDGIATQLRAIAEGKE